MSAKEMFVNYGYIYAEDKDFIRIQQLKECQTESIWYSTDYVICFSKEDKEIWFAHLIDKNQCNGTTIDMELLKAINKQIEELGWLE